MNKWLKRIVYMILLVSLAVFIAFIYMLKLMPQKYLYGIIMAGVVIAILGGYLIFYKKPRSKRSVITQLMSMMLSCVLIIASFYAYKFGRTVDLLTETTFQKRAISVIVLKKSNIKNEKLIPNSQLGYISSINTETMDYAVSKLKKEVGKFSLDDSKDFHEMVDELYSQKVDGIILDEAFRSLVEQYKSSFTKDTRVVYQMTKDESAVNAKSVNVTQNPFLVYVSGNDEYGDLSNVSRSDVNMLIGVNPKTHQILLISIPRDTYYPLHMNGQLDKFTHSGLYGLQESIDTLEDIIGEDINYYARMNFTSFIKIVDALGGITVNSSQAFTTKIGKYKIKKGTNTLNAKQALAFVRERKSFVDGDFERGRNQQRMIASIVKKVCSPAILTSFSGVLDTVSQSVDMNFTTDELNSLIQMQLSDMPSWDIQSYQIIGDSDKLPCYSMGGVYASVVVPYELSITQAKTYIDDFMANKKIKTETGNLDQ